MSYYTYNGKLPAQAEKLCAKCRDEFDRTYVAVSDELRPPGHLRGQNRNRWIVEQTIPQMQSVLTQCDPETILGKGCAKQRANHPSHQKVVPNE